MDGLLLASISFLSIVFCIIIAFILKLWFDERNTVHYTTKESLNQKNYDIKTDQNKDKSKSYIKKDYKEDAKQVYREDENKDTGKTSRNPTIEGTGNEERDEAEKKIGKKKMAKLQAKAEAKVQREQLQAEREDKKRRENELAKLSEEKRILEEQEEQKRLEKIRCEREEKEKRELEEYVKLKATFDIEEHGFDNENEVLSSINLNEQFISFIQKKKVVHVDELASHFHLKVDDIIERLTSLIEEKSITGVFDDRGLFVYINDAELQNVAKFINQRGRINLSVLAKNSNKFINLIPTD